MRIVILSTATLHHNQFVNDLQNRFPAWNFFVINEQSMNFGSTHMVFPTIKRIMRTHRFVDFFRLFPYVKINPFAKAEADFEKGFFQNASVPINETYHVENINKELALLQSLRPDLVIVFGTRKLSVKFLAGLTIPIINVHHALLPHIRGLDSAVWLAYFRKFDYLGTTIHYVTPGLDEGEILVQDRLHLLPEIELWQVRGYNTLLTIRLMTELLSDWEYRKNHSKENPLTVGTYYSFPSWFIYFVAAQHLRKAYRSV